MVQPVLHDLNQDNTDTDTRVTWPKTIIGDWTPGVVYYRLFQSTAGSHRDMRTRVCAIVDSVLEDAVDSSEKPLVEVVTRLCDPNKQIKYIEFKLLSARPDLVRAAEDKIVKHNTALFDEDVYYSKDHHVIVTATSVAVWDPSDGNIPEGALRVPPRNVRTFIGKGGIRITSLKRRMGRLCFLVPVKADPTVPYLVAISTSDGPLNDTQRHALANHIEAATPDE